jgi:hypothetical protein
LAALKDIYSAEDIDKAQAAANAFELAIPQRGHLRRQERHRARPQVTGDPQIQLGLPRAANRSAAAAFSAANSTSSCPEPRCSIEREPLRQDHTTCTAVAPDDVFTVRT